ncbi:pannexin-1 [Protopterus annectens]|uniref:pannexin-1 n=1 Tax=Protopterus annectens TaxID=7888 RepID=UPI001CFA985E|nr:pannexin-1 [Protopterus annectens]
MLTEMAIARLASDYVFSDFLLKEPTESKYKGVRLELAVDKLITCISVGLPLLLISLAFAQEIYVGTQISCFSPSSFSWRQAMYIDSFCWAALQQKHLVTSDSGRIPLWLHKFFPYILLLVAIVLYVPSLIWRFTAAPHLQSDLSFIMEELDKAYNRAIKLASSYSCNGGSSNFDLTAAVNESPSLVEKPEDFFRFPIVEEYLKTKKKSKKLIIKYCLCRLLTLIIIILACVYLGYYINLSSISDEFVCNVKTGILKNNTTIPDAFQCKLIAVGVFQVLSTINLVVYCLIAPVIIYSAFVPWRQRLDFLHIYELLPTFTGLHVNEDGYDDLSLYILFLEENISEVKSYKCLKVLENIKEEAGGNPLILLLTLGKVKTDVVDGKLLKNCASPNTNVQNNAVKLQATNSQPSDDKIQSSMGDKNVRQRLMDSSC